MENAHGRSGSQRRLVERADRTTQLPRPGSVQQSARPTEREAARQPQRLGRILETLRDPSAQALTLDPLRGLKGAAAALYFGAYFSAFAPALGASTRNRRPPRDPVNAVLSLSYTLLYSQATAACWAAGLDPALGALHILRHGRAVQACPTAK